jgi:hypothetical protein
LQRSDDLYNSFGNVSVLSTLVERRNIENKTDTNVKIKIVNTR